MISYSSMVLKILEAVVLSNLMADGTKKPSWHLEALCWMSLWLNVLLRHLSSVSSSLASPSLSLPPYCLNRPHQLAQFVGNTSPSSTSPAHHSQEYNTSHHRLADQLIAAYRSHIKGPEPQKDLVKLKY